MSVVDIAKGLDLREHLVHAAFRKFKENDLISPKAFVNTYRLGLSRYAFFFSLRQMDAKLKNKILSELESNELVPYLFEMSGDYQYEVNITVENVLALDNFLSDISHRFVGPFYEKTMALNTSFTLFGHKLLGRTKPELEPCSWGLSTEQVKIDQTDRKLLSALCLQETYETDGSLARKIGAPVSTVRYRLERLQQKGVFVRQTHRIDGSLLGYHYYLFMLYTRGDRTSISDKLYHFAEKHPNILYYQSNIGNWEFELGVVAKEPQAVSGLRSELHDNFGDTISSIKTLDAIKRFKSVDYPRRK